MQPVDARMTATKKRTSRDESVLQKTPDEEIDPKKGPAEILREEVSEALAALNRPIGGLFISGISAGLDVGFSLLLMAVMLTAAEGHFSPPVVRMLVANMYAVGFIFVVLGRSELFTEQTTLAVLPVLRRRATIRQLLRLWTVVFVANLVGGAIFARLATFIGPTLGIVHPRAFAEIAHKMIDHSGIAIFSSALLAGWLMGLLSWLVAAGRDTISQIVIVWLIATVIGFANLHHVVVGSIEVFAGVFATSDIGMLDFGRFLLWTTMGNIVGGSVFVALIKSSHARPQGQAETKGSVKASQMKGTSNDQ